MTYLATFHWGWLLASLLLGFAMGWIAVVHRGQRVSVVTMRWLAGLAAVLLAAALARVIPGRHASWGLSRTTVSNIESGAGSSEVSARARPPVSSIANRSAARLTSGRSRG